MRKLLQNIINKLRGKQSLDKLISRGLTVGKNFKQMDGCIIDPSHCWHIQIGDDVTLAPRVHILAHDASTKTFLGYTKVGNVKIGNRVFIGAGTIVLPGVIIGDDVVIGAGSVVSKSADSGFVYAGIPAKKICSIEEYLEKEKKHMNSGNVFDESFTMRKEITTEQKQILIDACDKNSEIYVE